MDGSRQSLYHIGLRYVALASKPALMWLLVATGSSAAAVEVGSLMLIASLIGMAMSNESHLQLYAARFSKRRKSNRALFRHLSDYLQALTTHILLIAAPAFLACMLFFPKVNPALAIGLALAERVADELLRFRLYSRDWNSWIALLLAKSLFPAAAAIAALLIVGNYVGFIYTVASLLFACMMVVAVGRPVHAAMRVVMRKIPDSVFIRSYLLTYFRVLSVRQVAAILGMNVILLDRYVGVTFWHADDVAYLLLAGQIVNGIFFAAEAKHLAENRANFINQDIGLASFWRWRSYGSLLLFCIGAAIIVFLAGTGLGLLPSARIDLYLTVAAMIVNYAIFYLSVPLNDYLYYRGKYHVLSLLHVVLFAVYAGLVTGLDALRPPAICLLVLLLMLLLRLLILAWMRRDFDRRAIWEV